MVRLFVLFSIVHLIFLVNCSKTKFPKQLPCSVKSVSLIDGDKDVEIKSFSNIQSDTIIKSADLPTKNLNMLINLNPENCASRIEIISSEASTHIDKTEPFTKCGENISFFTKDIDYFGFTFCLKESEKLEVIPYVSDSKGDSLIFTYKLE